MILDFTKFFQGRKANSAAEKRAILQQRLGELRAEADELANELAVAETQNRDARVAAALAGAPAPALPDLRAQRERLADLGAVIAASEKALSEFNGIQREADLAALRAECESIRVERVRLLRLSHAVHEVSRAIRRACATPDRAGEIHAAMLLYGVDRDVANNLTNPPVAALGINEQDGVISIPQEELASLVDQISKAIGKAMPIAARFPKPYQPALPPALVPKPEPEPAPTPAPEPDREAQAWDEATVNHRKQHLKEAAQQTAAWITGYQDLETVDHWIASNPTNLSSGVIEWRYTLSGADMAWLRDIVAKHPDLMNTDLPTRIPALREAVL